MGTVYQRALLIMTLFCAVVLLPLWLNVGWIFVAFGALPVTCPGVAHYGALVAQTLPFGCIDPDRSMT